MSKKLLIVSTSTVHGSGYLEYILDEVADFFAGREEVVFIPFARPSGITHDEYTALARDKFAAKGIRITGLHEADDPREAIRNAQGFLPVAATRLCSSKSCTSVDSLHRFAQP